MPLPRPYIPTSVQRDAALLQLGLDPNTAELDHDPALGLRLRTDDGGYIPDANDPRYLTWRSPKGHDLKTNGTKATTAGSDKHRIAKTKRLAAAVEESQRRILARQNGEPMPEGRRKRKIMSRNNLRRKARP